MLPSQRKRLRPRLDALECHMKWRPEEEGVLRGLHELEEHLKHSLKDGPYLAVEIYSLTAYIFTFSNEGKYKDLEKAERYANMALDESKKPLNKYCIKSHSSMDRSLVPRAILAHIMFEKHETQISQQLVEELESDWLNCTQEEEAFVKGVRAHALSRFGPSDKSISDGKYQKSLQLYREARDLDQTYPYHHAGVGKMLGRIRRLQNDNLYPCEEEIDAYKMVNDMLDGSDAGILINLARIFQDCKKIDPSSSTITDEELEDLVKQVKKLGLQQNSVEALNLCATFFLKQKKFSEQKECLDHLVTLPYQNYISFTKAARFYWKNNQKRDLGKAREYFQESIKSAPGGLYFWGEMNYIDFRTETEDHYCPISDLSGMLDRYKISTSRDKAMIHLTMGQVLLCRKKKEGLEHLQKALELDPMCNLGKKHKDVYGIKADTLLLELANELFYGTEQKLIKAWTLKTKFPPKLEEAKVYYDDVLEDDSLNPEALFGRSEIYHKQGDFTAAIQLLQKLEDRIPLKTEELCKSKLAFVEVLRNNQENPEDALSFCMECVRVGCTSAIVPTMELLTAVTCTETKRLLFENYADCLLCLRQNDRFSLDNPKYDKITEDQVHQEIKERLDIVDSRNEIFESRKSRWEMTLIRTQTGSDFQSKIGIVLGSSRECLDHMVNKLYKTHFFCCSCKTKQRDQGACTCKASAYYPYIFTSKEELNRRLAQRKLNNMQTIKKGRFAGLFDFIWTHSKANDPDSYSFVPEWIQLINDKKHEEAFCVEDFERMYILAHRAADFAEQVVQEFNKYI